MPFHANFPPPAYSTQEVLDEHQLCRPPRRTAFLQSYTRKTTISTPLLPCTTSLTPYMCTLKQAAKVMHHDNSVRYSQSLVQQHRRRAVNQSNIYENIEEDYLAHSTTKNHSPNAGGNRLQNRPTVRRVNKPCGFGRGKFRFTLPRASKSITPAGDSN